MGSRRRWLKAASLLALVTGGSRGIGAAIAWRWPATAGRLASTTAPTAPRPERVVGEIAELWAARRRPRPTPPTRGARVLFGAVEAHFEQPVLTLVNNAGITRDDLVPTLGDDEWAKVIETDLNAAFRLTNAPCGRCSAHATGRIINIASVAGLRANPGQANYAAAKAGLIALTKTAAVEVARRGITINAVAPGWIDTEMTAGVSRDLLDAVPARRAGKPEEVAACVRFLASEEAGYVTGAVLTVDGGLAA